MIRLAFPAPADRLSLNARTHWRTQRRQSGAWKQAAELYARDVANRTRLVRPLGRSIVHVEFVVATNRRRDADNAMPTVKPIVDGLVRAGWFTDDTADLIAHRVSFVVDKTCAGQVTVTITPWEDA